MARRDIESVLVIGSGPIVVGQACEFDYSGTVAVSALRAKGYRTVLVNSNPATIMTDPELADATYIEPLTVDFLERIIERERPDALLSTMGGQVALNLALELEDKGVLDAFGVELIGASRKAIETAENRSLFVAAVSELDLASPRSGIAHNLDEAVAVMAKIGLPCVVRPSFTLAGSGGGIAFNQSEFINICKRGLSTSPQGQILIDEWLAGWKEFELEVVRDEADNCIIVCSIENIDPMGVHTGDSITVAPAQTLTDREYQKMRQAAFAIMRKVGVTSGGSNVQFAVDPKTGRQLVIEMNPRVSRSSALASKASGFPIAKIAALLAVGYRLDELQNDLTDLPMPASFEPSLDYVACKIPRFNFEKFPGASDRLGTQMQAVGEVMALGRTFKEALQKALRSLEDGTVGLDGVELPKDSQTLLEAKLSRELAEPGPKMLWYLAEALRQGWSAEKAAAVSRVDPWFVHQIGELVKTELELAEKKLADLSRDDFWSLKRQGFADAKIASLVGAAASSVAAKRRGFGIRPVYKRIDSCAGEFPASTAYLYSCYDQECEADPGAGKKVVVLGSGPNRIGQGIEFDYCCVQAVKAFRSLGFETIMVNCNPETVSTDCDQADRLYFEPVTVEDVMEILDLEKPAGVVVQFGGQTPLKLSQHLAKAGIPIMGTAASAIDIAEDRERFRDLCQRLGLLQPKGEIAKTPEEVLAAASRIGYPVVVRPSYVLGGLAMEIIHSRADLAGWLHSGRIDLASGPLLLDRFLDEAIEVDVDVAGDGLDYVIGAVVEHVERAGVHSGDSACSLPAVSLTPKMGEKIREQAIKTAAELKICGLMNMQFALQQGGSGGEDLLYVLEVNPRASRTIPFISKATGRQLARIAASCMAGVGLFEQGVTREPLPPHFSVKEAVLPFDKYLGSDPILGPEMRSTGESMGQAESFGEAYFRAELGAGHRLPTGGCALLSVKDRDKPRLPALAKRLAELGFALVATKGTAACLGGSGLRVRAVNKVAEGRPHVLDEIINGKVTMIVNTTEGSQSILDSASIRQTARANRIYCAVTIESGEAVCSALESKFAWQVTSSQKLHRFAQVSPEA